MAGLVNPVHQGCAVAFLGPEGTFSHQAALQAIAAVEPVWVVSTGSTTLATETTAAAAAAEAAQTPETAPQQSTNQTDPPALPIPVASVAEVFAAVSQGKADLGVVAVENTVEGPVFATLDGLIASTDVVAIGEVILPITFTAFTKEPVLADDPSLTEATAHPHGLAQVRQYTRAHGWHEVPAASNAAACRDITPNQVAFGPALCGDLYGLQVLKENVADFPGAATRFLVLAKRSTAQPQHFASPNWRTLLAITPRATGPGVLARITKQFARRKLNLSSLFSRPLKGQNGQYLFVVTLDAPPWQPESRALLADLLAAGDAVKTLGVWLANSDHATIGSVLPGSLPPGSVTGADPAGALAQALLW
ncbi:MAG: prephenate dehydratase [Cellulomonadaceae bacterium]|jgi:prephenate dehydratase/chorismate mutase/prephenate dehydratase|nr:prephenate dehydratase [Cellulomonadaceae bacterium]